MRNDLQTGRAGPSRLGLRAVPPPRPGAHTGAPRAGALLSALLLGLASLAGARARAAELVPFEYRQPGLTYNFQSLRGVPISAVSNSPAGSDGRMPTGQNASGSFDAATASQFRGFLGFGALAVRTNWLTVKNSPLLQGATAFSGSVAVAMQLPRAYSNTAVAMVLRRAQVGAPFLARKMDCSFGSVVEVPDTDENVADLAVVKETYWQPEPCSTNNHVGSGYYYSPHAQKVFAVQSGPMLVTWRKLAPYTVATVPTNYVNQLGDRSFETNGGSLYLLYTKSYIVSGSPVKPPLKMYWTEREYRMTGLPVAVPQGRVGGINIAYNSDFPRTVDEEYRGPGYTSPTEGSTNAGLSELRTLWYDQGQGYIYAYNKEGRAFVEFLGDASPDGRTREHLGFELVDVVKQPVMSDITVELGERLVPPAPESADELFAQPITTLDALFVYRHTQPVSGRLNLYAVRQTTSPNDSLVHWLEEGVAGIKWPRALARYQQVWPAEMGRYSHYVRPQVATENEARATAVQLSTDNIPCIAYQDPLDRPRAKLTEDYKFYTFLDATAPAHRALLRFTAGEYVAFERVFSWLDSSLRTTNFANSVATNLTEVDNYVNYPAHYKDYTNRLALAMAAYQPKYVAYSNYLVASSNYVTQYYAYTNYVGYNSQLALYNTYTNYQAQYAAYTNYLAQSAAYTNQSVSYTAYTNWQAQYTAYTNWAARYTAYTNYLANPTRGVNGIWKLYLRDTAVGDFGSISSWNLLVVATNVSTGVRTTNTFTGGAITINDFVNATPYPSTVTVSGIANTLAVQSVQVKWNGFNHTYPSDVDALLVGPTNTLACALYGKAGDGTRAIGLNLVFDDSASSLIPLGDRPSGTYRPTDNYVSGGVGGAVATARTSQLDALLMPRGSNPGTMPTYPGDWPLLANGNWTLTLADWQSNPAVGSLGSWAVQVASSNLASGLLVTNEFTYSNALSITYGAPAYATVAVSGIANPVKAVRLKLNNLSHANAYDLHVFLAGPGGGSATILDYPGPPYTYAVNSLMLLIDDAGAAPPYQTSGLTSGTYRPNSGTLASLLVPATPGAAPTPVSNPGSAPVYAAYPGAAPPYAANPGDPPTVVLQPALPEVGPVPSPDLWISDFTTPRLVQQTVYVGDRIAAPTGELGQGSYLAGHINAALGTLYHPTAYIDPLVSGFPAANQGAIIPVNAVPGTNLLEVWWFRTNNVGAGPNAGDNRLGFATIYWPSVLGRYTLAWPTNPREIVLASKIGSGTLDTREALGSIYRQNDPTLPGYNPNEEHALMAGGTAFATRDDLNLTSPTNYSSNPFVLVQYTAADGRPAVSAFKVLREKPSAGYVFDYIVPAGQILQAPMPLPLLAKPVLGTGDYAVNYNTEPPQSGGDLPGGWSSAYATNDLYSHYQRFTWRDRHNDFWVYRGPHAGLPVLQVGTYVTTNKTFRAFTNAVAVVNTAFSCTLHASRQDEYLSLSTLAAPPEWLSIMGLKLRGTPGTNDVGTNTLQVVVEDLYDHTRVTNSLRLAVVRTGSTSAQAGLSLSSTNQQSGSVVVFTDRPPFLAASPNSSNSFTMRYYYQTEAAFDWPGMASPPDVGTIVPYLRPINPTNGVFIGDAAVRDTDALDIVYRPVWPERDPADSSKVVPTLPFGATLSTTKFNLPGVRDMLTAELLYQQSIASNLALAEPSAILHDATREKYSDLEAQFLTALPGGVLSDYYQGYYYFPNLPPHLANRLYFNANRGAKGTLVLKGQYVAETLGESYVMLNVLRGTDLATAKDLCPAGDTDKSKWDALVEGLATDLETFCEDPNVPGSYIVDDSLTEAVGVGALAEVKSANTAVDSYAVSAVGPGSGYVTLIEASGTAFTQVGDPVAMHIFKVGGTGLYVGEVKVIAAANPLSEQVTFQHTADLAGRFDEYEYEWKIATPVDGLPPVSDDTMSRFLSLAGGTDMPRRTLGGAGIQALCDNYVVLRYRAKDPAHPLYNQWSDWTTPKLAEGWIKRVLAGINPFNQRVTDLFNNAVNTDVSMLTQAGKRWEGDVALNLDTINNYGLIEIYETVLRRGRMLSIESGYNFGPANDALLLAAGYLNDLYMMEGGEAWADAANPTIGIGTKDKTYGDIATALFAFKGQVGSLLAEELALLRGRDDFLLPGVQVSPLYNRLVWNYTRGIDAGEVIYALNYNIQENPNKSPDGTINAEDAAIMFPQGHGDAYGHYLTALKGYYSLLLNSCFDWVPRIEAVNVLGQPISVDYQDERKFVAAAAALARSGRQIFDLTWREDYKSVHSSGWSHLGATRVNTQRQYLSPGGVTNSVTRYWGLDHWGSRTGQGAFLNWVVGNAILPDQDTLHEGIQKIDRTTVPELTELVTTAEGLQTAMDNAEGGLSPLGIPEGGLAFDINPAAVVGTDNGTHFEQIYQRAKTALNNAVASFDDAKDVTRLMRSEQDSLADLQSQVSSQEHAYNNSLSELYGSPYPEDIGAGKTWKQGYTGPDLIHYMYADLPEVDWFGDGAAQEPATFNVDVQQLPEDWLARNYTDLDFITLHTDGSYAVNQHYIEYTLGPHGFYDKPQAWTGARYSPGKLQQAISEMIAAHTRLKKALDDAQGDKQDFDKAIRLFRANVQTHDQLRSYEKDLLIADQTLASVQHAFDLVDAITTFTSEQVSGVIKTTLDSFPESLIAGVAAGGDLTSSARAACEAAGLTIKTVPEWGNVLAYIGKTAFAFATETANRWVTFDSMAPLEWQQELRGAVADLGNTMNDLNDQLVVINQQLRAYDDAQRKYRALLAEGDRVQAEREIFRQRSSAVVQGFRTRDAAFRLFRNEKLERYKTLFDLSARYVLLAANAYDYETGLLHTSAGRAFVARIINARALGVVRNGEPQYAGSNTGDPGLSSVLAEMKADWDVLRGRLGFNNPDAYGTTVSLRTENLRILPSSDGDATWKDVLQAARQKNILEDADVSRYCMQIDDGSGLPVPGIVLTFSSTIANGYNLFGKELAAGDNTFSASSFATKIFGVGVALTGYRGMADPSANSSVGGTSPADPGIWYLDPLALAATPYIYLIPVGVDSMRSPPLGDTTSIRTWSVDDVAIPMPFNIGASDFSTKQLWQSSDSLTEALFAIRKHQAFRPVSTTSVFSQSLYGDTGTLKRSQYTNNRLVGRSVWNSQWKLVIPGRTLLNNPNEGLDRFIQTVTDVKLHFVTYSYSGN
jgi:subtilisin-like proprotein convertase family protein